MAPVILYIIDYNCVFVSLLFLPTFWTPYSLIGTARKNGKLKSEKGLTVFVWKAASVYRKTWFCQNIVLPQYHFAKVWFCQNIILPKFYFATISFCQSIILQKYCFCQNMVMPTVHRTFPGADVFIDWYIEIMSIPLHLRIILCGFHQVTSQGRWFHRNPCKWAKRQIESVDLQKDTSALPIQVFHVKTVQPSLNFEMFWVMKTMSVDLSIGLRCVISVIVRKCCGLKLALPIANKPTPSKYSNRSANTQYQCNISKKHQIDWILHLHCATLLSLSNSRMQNPEHDGVAKFMGKSACICFASESNRT